MGNMPFLWAAKLSIGSNFSHLDLDRTGSGVKGRLRVLLVILRGWTQDQMRMALNCLGNMNRKTTNEGTRW